MSEPGSRRGRVHDAEGAREAILNAAEEVFAEHGFDGARIDAIAARSGYNKSLIFHYFGDKLGLYAEVIKRADKQTGELQWQVIGPLLEDGEIISTDRFRTLIRTVIRTTFDYLVENPNILHIFVWEQAEGWQTYAKIASQLNTEDLDHAQVLISTLQRAGLLRPSTDPIVLFIMAVQACMSYLSSIPMYQMLLPDKDFSSPAALERIREQIVDFVIHGMMVDPPETKP